MNILVIGKGSCEHAIALKLRQSSNVECVYAAPGNAGTALDAVNVPISEYDLNAISLFVQNKNIGLVVVNSLASLSRGLVDILKREGIPILGPTKVAANLENSKVFCKKVLTKASISTPRYKTFDDRAVANDWLRQNISAPVVIKADGFTDGKGVFFCEDYLAARDATFRLMHKREFGFAGSQIVVEEYLSGEKASVVAIVDGQYFRILHVDAAVVSSELDCADTNADFQKRFGEEIILPLLKSLKSVRGTFSGILCVDFIVTSHGPSVIGFKVRFHDSKCQSILTRMTTDLAELLTSAAQGKLDQCPPPHFDEKKVFSVSMTPRNERPHDSYVVVASDIEKERRHNASYSPADVKLFFDNARLTNETIFSTGGKFLLATARGDDILEARKKVYQTLSQIKICYLPLNEKDATCAQINLPLVKLELLEE